MPKYKVRISRYSYADIEVEASNPDIAEDLALNAAGADIQFVRTEYKATDVEQLPDPKPEPEDARYELFYSTGGHGGPYHTLCEAQESALRLLKGSTSEQYIIIAQYDSSAILRVPWSILPMGFREVDRKAKA